MVAKPEAASQSYIPLKPPFGYYGAKQRIAAHLTKTLPPHNAWVEAFCGSAALTLAKPPAPIEVINDIDDQIVNLFEQLRTNQEALCRAIALTPYARAEYQKAREHENDISAFERARRFLIATMMTVNGANGGKNAGFSFSQSYSRGGHEARVNRWNKLPDRLELVAQRLKNARIENRDAREIIAMFADRPATLIYLDPPYNLDRKQRYAVDIVDENFHSELLTLCCGSKCMIFISGYDNDLYNETLTSDGGWAKKYISTTTRDTTGRDYPRTEVVWFNRHFTEALRGDQSPVELTPKEAKLNKVNPRR